MNLSLILLLTIIFLSVLITIFLNRYHILLMLLAIELMSAIIITALLYTSVNIVAPLTPLLVLLTFSAAEARLGLALLVILIRTVGNDYVSALPLYKS